MITNLKPFLLNHDLTSGGAWWGSKVKQRTSGSGVLLSPPGDENLGPVVANSPGNRTIGFRLINPQFVVGSPGHLLNFGVHVLAMDVLPYPLWESCWKSVRPRPRFALAAKDLIARSRENA